MPFFFERLVLNYYTAKSRHTFKIILNSYKDESQPDRGCF